MTTTGEIRGALICVVLLVAGCGSPSGSSDKSPATASTPKSEPTTTEAATSGEQPASSAAAVSPAPAIPAAAPSPPPPQPPAQDQSTRTSTTPVAPAPASAVAAAPDPAPAEVKLPAPASAPVAEPTPAVVDAGGAIAVAATKPGLSRVGSDTCEMCHDVQFASWSETAHAARNPPLDCESCHGPGSEYKAMAIMKDPAKALAAGLVIPERSFCSKCHKQGVTDDFLKRAHAHAE